MKIMDKLIINKKIFIFLITIALSAIICGSIFVIIIGKNDSLKITSEVSNYMNNLNTINYFESFKNVFFSNILFLIIIWIIGISILGIPISIILYFLKLFSLGFTISSFILTYNIKGVLINIIYLFPAQIINLFVTIYLLSISLIISFKLLESMFKRKSFNFNFVSGYKRVLIISILIFLISNLYEIFIIPKIIKLVLHLIK